MLSCAVDKASERVAEGATQLQKNSRRKTDVASALDDTCTRVPALCRLFGAQLSICHHVLVQMSFHPSLALLARRTVSNTALLRASKHTSGDAIVM